MSRKLEEMTQADIEAILGPGVPGDPNDPAWMSRRWKCGRCETVHQFDAPVANPSPCSLCGGIVFEKITRPLQ